MTQHKAFPLHFPLPQVTFENNFQKAIATNSIIIFLKWLKQNELGVILNITEARISFIFFWGGNFSHS